MSAQLDLRELALERPEEKRRQPPRRRPYVSRYLIPGAVALGFLALLGWALRDQFAARKPVTVVPVVVTRAEVQRAGTPLFQAAGWIEPRPTPMHVAALTEGVVDRLLVVEGQPVEADEPVARLIDVDAKIALREAETELASREAELRSARAELKAARLRVEHPVHLQAAHAEADSLLAKTETELAKVPFSIESAEARVEYARRNLEAKRESAESIPGILIRQTESEHLAAQAELRELKQRGPRLEREVDALRKRAQALATQLELLIDESRRLEDAEAQVLAAEARRDRAQLAVEKAQLSLQRTVVRSPVAGRVMELVAYPGARVMGLDSSASHSSSTVVTLYDPAMLQVRADVRLEDVPLVQPGQVVEVETAASEEPLRGVVLTATSAANIQKNTLEVKVALEDPPPSVRPEMLVTATFLAPPRPESEDDSQDDQRLLVPRQLVEESDGGHAVWIVDESGLARRQSVRLGAAGTEQLVEIVQGLTPTDKLISGGREGLTDRDPVAITGEDTTLGMTPPVGQSLGD